MSFGLVLIYLYKKLYSNITMVIFISLNFIEFMENFINLPLKGTVQIFAEDNKIDYEASDLISLEEETKSFEDSNIYIIQYTY